jgi:hypothetical protein
MLNRADCQPIFRWIHVVVFRLCWRSVFHLIYGTKRKNTKTDFAGYLISSSGASFAAAFLIHKLVFFTSLFNGSIRDHHAAAAVGVVLSLAYPYIIDLLGFCIEMFKKYAEKRVKK